jgi:integrase
MQTMRRNKSGLPKYCSWNVDRTDGKRRVRFRHGGVSIYLAGTPWGEDFMRQYAAALDSLKAPTANIGMERTKPGTINALIVSYYTLVFPTIEPSTQKMRRSILERFRRDHGDKPVARLEPAHIAAIVAAMKKTPNAANNFRKVVHSLLEHAMALGWIRSNPAKLVKKFKLKGDGFHTWSEGEVVQFEKRHPAGTKAHLALMLMLYTGLRRSDIIGLGWQFIRGNKIEVRTQKTDMPLMLPIAPELAQALKGAPRKNLTFLLTFLLTAFGAPFSFNGFGNWFRERCNEAGLPQCSAHGLRKLAATRMANAGCTDRELMAVFGWRGMSEVSRYVRAADQARLAEQAFAKGRKSEQKLSSKATMLDKTARK